MTRLEQSDWPDKDQGCFTLGDQSYVVQGMAWSPLGDRLAFILTQGTFPGYAYTIQVTSDGRFGVLNRLWIYQRVDFETHQYLNWSPMDDRIAFLSEPHSGPESDFHYNNIYFASVDGNQWSQLTHVRRLPESVLEPVWSPDAKLLAIAVDAPHNGVGIAKSDGSGVNWLTEEAISEFPAVSFNIFTHRPNLASLAPAWYPDGSALLFRVDPIVKTRNRAGIRWSPPLLE